MKLKPINFYSYQFRLASRSAKRTDMTYDEREFWKHRFHARYHASRDTFYKQEYTSGNHHWTVIKMLDDVYRVTHTTLVLRNFTEQTETEEQYYLSV